MTMKATRIMVSIAAAMFLFAACADTSNSPMEPNISVNYTLTNAEVKDTISDGAPGTLTVTRVRLLATQLKLHITGKAYSEDEYRLLKLGPLAFNGYPFTNTLVAQGQITSDEYDVIKFEIHRFQPNELSMYSADTAFAVFATPERYSVVIDGVIDNAVNFTYQTDIVANIELPFSSVVVKPRNSTAEIQIQFDAAAAFMSRGLILDPRQAANKIQLDYQIKSALKAVNQY